jgi:hypothetical protein
VRISASWSVITGHPFPVNVAQERGKPDCRGTVLCRPWPIEDVEWPATHIADLLEASRRREEEDPKSWRIQRSSSYDYGHWFSREVMKFSILRPSFNWLRCKNSSNLKLVWILSEVPSIDWALHD